MKLILDALIDKKVFMVIHIKILGSSKNAHDNHNKDIVTLNVNRLLPWPETVIQVKNTQHNTEKKISFKL